MLVIVCPHLLGKLVLDRATWWVSPIGNEKRDGSRTEVFNFVGVIVGEMQHRRIAQNLVGHDLGDRNQKPETWTVMQKGSSP